MSKTLPVLITRDIKMFFREKGLFFTALITPMILLVLYATFLSNVYRDSFVAGLPETVKVSSSVLEGVVAGQLISSLLAVSCVTVAFCSNMLSVQDKADRQIDDFAVSPVKGSELALAYYIASLASTLIVTLIALCAGLAFIGIKGWYLSASDVLLSFLDVVLVSMFGTALSTAINFFLSSRGQISAVGSIVSSCYGFICGAYMPISSFGAGLQKVISFLPGTYATGLMRNHLMRGAIDEFCRGFPEESAQKFLDAVDCNLYFFGSRVSVGGMYLIVGCSVALLVALCMALYKVKGKAAVK